MTLGPIEPSELEHLLSAAADGSLTEEQTQRLDSALQQDPAARRAYLQYMHLHANLHRLLLRKITGPSMAEMTHIQQLVESSTAAPADDVDERNTVGGDHARALQELARQQFGRDHAEAVIPPGQSKRLSPSLPQSQGRGSFFTASRFSAWRIAALFFVIASAVMTLTSPTWLSWWKNTPVATLADAVDAQWDAPQARLDVGDHLPYGPLYLKSGYAAIRLDNGVKLIVQGPSHFSIDSLRLAHLDEGKLTADVPHAASGYSVKIPSGMVTDIGTTFGVTAFLNKESTVQVLKGSVQAQLFSDDGKQKSQVVLTEDHAVALNPNIGSLASIPAEPDAYATDIRHLPPPPEAPYARWQKYSDQLRKDPSLLAYYTFDNKDQAPEKLLNRAAATAGKFDGQIENAKWDDGRFQGKPALKFNGDDSRVKLNIPQQMDQLTLAMWVRPDAWDAPIIALLDADGWSPNRLGEVHWQVWDQTLNIGVFSPEPQHKQSSISLDAIGQWMLLVATIDTRTGVVTHYYNGIAVGSTKTGPTIPVSLGAAEIGRWNSLKETEFPSGRDLRGRVDELAIFSRTLTAAEIQAMYKAGRDDK
jgi:hypothetical protein